jgi:hypothetical protein
MNSSEGVIDRKITKPHSTVVSGWIIYCDIRSSIRFLEATEPQKMTAQNLMVNGN